MTNVLATTGAKQLSITLRRSPIGKIGKHKKIIAGLGLRKMNQTVSHPDTPQIRGMIRKIGYLLEVKEIS
ncbi:MAG: 50S ribosomal protein L30 [Candidatus Manganitrophaceae bacterium]